MKNAAGIAILAAAALAQAACFSASPEKAYFQIHVQTAPAATAFPKVLFLDRIDVDSLYDDFRILYRLSPFEINYYAYYFWAEKPAKLFHEAILRYLETARPVARVITEQAKGNADWILRCAVRQVEEVDEGAAWYARLGMFLEISDAKTGAVLASRRFDRREPLSQKAVAEVPGVLSRILGEELDALFQELRGK